MSIEPRSSSPQSAETVQKRLPPAVWLLSGVSFFADVSSEMVYPLMPLFLVGALGASKSQLGLVEGVAILLVAFMNAWAGFRSDRSGRRLPLIRFGYGLPVLGKAVIAIAGSWYVVLAGRLLDRFGKGMRGAPRDAMLADVVAPEQRGQAFGLHRAFDTAGALVGSLIGALLLWWLMSGATVDAGSAAAETTSPSVSALRVVLGVGAILGFLSFALSWFVREPEPTESANQESSKTTESPTADCQDNDLTAEPAHTTGTALSHSYWIALLILVTFSFANSSDTFLLLRASEMGVTSWGVVLLYAMYNLTYSVFSYPAGSLSDRWGRWRIIVSGWVIYALVYAGFALLPATSSWGLWPLMAIYGVYMALTEGVGKALIVDCAPRARRGFALGIFHATTGVTTLLASLIAGWAWDRFGASAAFSIGSIFAMLAIAIALGNFWRTKNHRPKSIV
ncbi:MAG: MFS transporter [Pirellulaceae bacterium]